MPVAQLVQGAETAAGPRRPRRLRRAARAADARARACAGPCDRLVEARRSCRRSAWAAARVARGRSSASRSSRVDEQEIEIARGHAAVPGHRLGASAASSRSRRLAASAATAGRRPRHAVRGPRPEPIAKPEAGASPRLSSRPRPLAASTATLPGIGPTLAERLAERGLETVEDLRLARAAPLRRPARRAAARTRRSPRATRGRAERTTLVAEVVRVALHALAPPLARRARVGDGDGGATRRSRRAGSTCTAAWPSAFVPGAARRRSPARLASARRRLARWPTPTSSAIGSDDGAAAKAGRSARATPRSRASRRRILRAACRRRRRARAPPRIVDGVPAGGRRAARAAVAAEALARAARAARRLSPSDAVAALDAATSPLAPPARLRRAVLPRRSRSRGARRERRGEPRGALPAVAGGARRPSSARPAVRAHRRAAPGDRRDRRATSARAEPDEPPAPGRRRRRQDRGRLRRGARWSLRRRPPGRAHGADRDPRRAARRAPSSRWAERLGHRLALLTASTPRGVRESTLGTARRPAQSTSSSAPTRCSPSASSFADLGLVVIDEQHRFGVAQRVAPARQGRAASGRAAPPGHDRDADPAHPGAHRLRRPRRHRARRAAARAARRRDTRVLAGARGRSRGLPARCASAARRRRARLRGLPAGRAPSAEEDGGRVWADADDDRRARWPRSSRPRAVGLVHGRMPSRERDAAMAALRDGAPRRPGRHHRHRGRRRRPRGDLMVIEDADRFGLAQLHQLRGRVGRGGGESACLLLTAARAPPTARRRLDVMAETCDGFRIAEEDLRHARPRRAPRRAPGRPAARCASATSSQPRRAPRATPAREAERVLDADPDLAAPAHAAARQVLDRPPAPTPRPTAPRAAESGYTRA